MSRTRLSAIFAALVLALIGLTALTGPAGAAPTPGSTTFAPPTPLGTPTMPPTTPAMTSTPPPRPTTAPPPTNDGLTPPSRVTDLRVTALTPTSVTLSWSPATPGCCDVAGYEFTYYERFNDLIRKTAVGNVTSATFGVSPTKEYSYSMVAFDSAGRRSAASNSVSFVVPYASTGDVTPPSGPTDLRLTGTTLTWTGSTDNVGVTGYDIYRFDGLYISTRLATVTGTSASLPTAGGGWYFLYVRARDAAGNLSASSNTITVTTPTSQPPPPPPPCGVAYTVSSHWPTGFVAEVTVTNTRSAPIEGWTLMLRYGGDQRITQAWGATATQTGAEVTLTALNWNRVIGGGGTVKAGMLGAGSSGAQKPVYATLNGVPCSIAN